MMKQDGVSGGKRMGEKMKLPLTQTVFLPKEAMGVRYIDRVRASVFVERVSPMEQGFWLRGFFELTLEYQGVEGRGLCKHRLMLPLKVPVRGLELEQAEAGDFHAVIKHPMIKLLSPYVLEFSADLLVDYLGEGRRQEDGLQPPAPPRRSWQCDVPMPDENKPEARIESKIDHFFLGKAADNLRNEQPRMISSNGILDRDDMEKKRKIEADERRNVDTSPTVGEEHRLPMWQFEPSEHSQAEQRAQSRIVEMPTVRTMADGVGSDVKKSDVKKSDVKKSDVENLVEKPVEKQVDKRVENPVENLGGKFVSKRAVNPDPSLEQIYASRLNKNRFRSILTAAAISRLQARGEDLLAVDEDAGSMARGVLNNEKEANCTENIDKCENFEEVATIKAEDKNTVVAEEVVEEVDVSGGILQEKSAVASENEGESVLAEEVREVSTEVSAKKADVEKNQAVFDEENDVAVETVENTAESVDEIVEKQPLAATEAVSEDVSEAISEAVEVVAEAPIKSSGVEMVNNRGVRVRLGASSVPQKQAPPTAPKGGFSIKYYVVKPGDDAMSIALKHNISLERLRDANRLPEGELAAGTLLRIPR